MPALRRRRVIGALLIGALAPIESIQAEEPTEAAPAAPVRQVGEVTVTATRGKRDVLDVPGHVTVITREEIEKSGERHLADLLRREPGLFVTNTTTNPAGTVIEARGFNNGGALGSSLLVLVDGRRVNEADTGSTDWALLRLDAIERVEIVRGPVSALYGDNAIGGVIQIITRAPEEELSATLQGWAGTYDSANGSVFLGGQAGPVGASLFVDQLTTDAYRDGADFESGDFEGKLRFALGGRGLLGFSAGYHSDERELPGTLSKQEIQANGRRARAPSSLGDEQTTRRRFVQVFADLVLAESVLLKLHSHHDRRNDRFVTTSRSFGTARTSTRKNASSFGAQLQVDRPLGSLENRLTLGGEFLREETDRDIAGSFSDVVRDIRRVSAGFLQNELSLTGTVRLSTGVRFDHARYRLARVGEAVVRPDFDVWSPRAALSWRPRAWLAAYVSYARGFRLPNFDEDTPFFGSTPDLDPQKSDSYEIGLKVKTERLSGTLALFTTSVDDEIILDPTTFTNTNFDRVRHRGVELSARGRVVSWLEIWGGYTFQDVEIRRFVPNRSFEGRRMPTEPRHRGTLGVRAQLPAWTDVTVLGTWVGNRVLSNDFANARPKLGKYGRYDVVLGFRPSLGDRVEGALTVAVRNVFDREYEDFGVFDAFQPDLDFFYPASDRSYEVGLRVTVKR